MERFKEIFILKTHNKVELCNIFLRKFKKATH